MRIGRLAGWATYAAQLDLPGGYRSDYRVTVVFAPR
jgi:hypothetical protein